MRIAEGSISWIDLLLKMKSHDDATFHGIMERIIRNER